MSDTQKVQTDWIWNTKGVKSGAKEINDALNDVGKTAKKAEGHNHNLVQGIKDLFEGRAIFGVQRLVKEFKFLERPMAMGAVALKRYLVPLAVTAPAAYAAAKAFSLMRQEMARNNEEAKKLESSFLKVNRAATFSTSAEGIGSLSGKRAELTTQLQGERALQADTGTLEDGGTGSRAAARAWHTIRGSNLATGLFGEEKSAKQIRAESNLRTKATQNSLKKNYGMQIGALGNETELARMRGPSGENNPFLIRMKELEINKEKEMMELKERGLGEDRLALWTVKEKYKWLERTVTAEKAIAEARFSANSRALGISGGGGSEFAKGLGASANQMSISGRLVNSGLLSSEERNAEGLKFHAAYNSSRESLMGRYLDPATGKRRRAGVIQKEFRDERNATRRRNAFLRKVDAGQYNLETGRKANSIMSGLTTGGLGSFGGLLTGTNATAAKGKTDGSESAAFLEKIASLLNERLPGKN